MKGRLDFNDIRRFCWLVITEPEFFRILRNASAKKIPVDSSEPRRLSIPENNTDRAFVC